LLQIGSFLQIELAPVEDQYALVLHEPSHLLRPRH